MKIYSESPQAIGAVIDAGMRLFKRSFIRLLPLAMVAAIVSSLPAVVSYIAIGSVQPSAGQISKMMGMVIGLFFVATMISMIIYAAMVDYVHIIAQDKINSIWRSLAAAFKMSLWIILSTVLYFIAIIFGLGLLIIPGVIVMATGMFFLNATMTDGKKGLAALRFSHQMVWGNWWRATVIISVVMTMAIAFAVLVVMAVGIGATFMPMLGEELVALILELSYNLLVLPIMMPLIIAVSAVCYNDLKLRKQGGDLKARISEPKQDDGHHGMAGVHPVAHG